MGGISVIIYTNSTTLNTEFFKSFMNIKHRGPDDSNYITLSTDNLNNLTDLQKNTVYMNLSKDELRNYKQYHFTLGYHRLSINDTSFNATQPFEDPIINKFLKYKDIRNRTNKRLVCNGEIYNYNELLTENHFTDMDLCSTCDVEIILPLYIKYGLNDMINKLDGEFSFCLTENINTFQLNTIQFFAVRDYIGMRPLYYVTNNDNSLYFFVSEIKALPKDIITNTSFSIIQVPPGTYWSFQNTIIDNSPNVFIEYYSLNKYNDLNNCIIQSKSPDTLTNIYQNIYTLVTDSIVSRYNSSNHEVGILLSGGFDSCLLSSILVKYLVSINYDFLNKPLHIFTVGDSLGSDDIDCEYAKKFIKYIENKYEINIHHHIININNIELLASDIDKIIYQLETFDPETIKESILFYYLLNYIKKYTNVKVLLTGDGIDELGSYDNFNDLDDILFQQKSVQLLQNLHKFDLLRIDKISNLFGLEIRHPFLNKQFIEYMLSIHPSLRRPGIYSHDKPPIDKYILRKTFDSTVCGEELMENEHLWREHHCLCDSLTNFELRLTNYIDTFITDNLYNISLNILMNEIDNNFNTLPNNKEQMYYRLIYRKHYPSRDNLIEYFWNSLWE